ncbi:DNA-binding transcriptional MerR regulator [Flavimobilis soli]|uniref:DNA-binding transcriptional MerR regulator n=2 Tax=Flavimobilis soli TaxID=442709 RepID=A0A2A9EBJ2_9MICO|nr:DNA-binding transcriptional MerR regulator [Flavimobilis soli]
MEFWLLDGQNRVMAPQQYGETSVDGEPAEPVELAAARAKPGVAVAVVAKRLGVAPATLRTWDRRYGLGPSERSAGSHRRYTRDDVLRLMVMRRLTLEGVAPADAAKAALEADIEVERARRASAVSAQHEARRSAATLSEPEQQGPSDSKVVHFARSAAPSRTSTPADVVDAALAHDADATAELLMIAPGSDILTWWTQLVVPALTKLGERTVLAKPGEAPLQVLSSAAMRAIRVRQSAQENESGSPHPSQMRRIVLIFTPPDEPQPLAAHALAAALMSKGVMARIVMGPAGAHRAQEVVTMVRPAAVVLITQMVRPDLAVVGQLCDGNPELPVFVAVADDTAAEDLPKSSQVQRVRSFSGLFHEVCAVATQP